MWRLTRQRDILHVLPCALVIVARAVEVESAEYILGIDLVRESGTTECLGLRREVGMQSVRFKLQQGASIAILFHIVLVHFLMQWSEERGGKRERREKAIYSQWPTYQLQ